MQNAHFNSHRRYADAGNVTARCRDGGLTSGSHDRVHICIYIFFLSDIVCICEYLHKGREAGENARGAINARICIATASILAMSKNPDRIRRARVE